MRLCSKLFLLLALAGWGISYTQVGSEVLFGIPKPIAAVLFGLFLITWILPRRDMEEFEQDQALRNEIISNERKKRRARSRMHWKPRHAHS
jgi:hypothetical protein